MEQSKIDLTEAEWNIMECLWEQSPRTGREIIECLKERKEWSRSTTLTLLRRLEEKNAVRGDQSGNVKAFYPEITRECAVLQETKHFLDRVYHGSLGMMISAFTKKQSLSKEEIQELYNILEEMEK